MGADKYHLVDQGGWHRHNMDVWWNTVNKVVFSKILCAECMVDEQRINMKGGTTYLLMDGYVDGDRVDSPEG